MKKIIGLKPATIIEIISALFILLFVYTGINKFMAIRDLKTVLKDYPLIGSISNLVAWGLPITEIFVTLLLFFPRTKLIGHYSAFVLMSIFTVYLVYMIIFTPNLPCTCGGMLEGLSWPQHLAFNAIFISLALIAIRFRKNETKNKQRSEESAILYT